MTSGKRHEDPVVEVLVGELSPTGLDADDLELPGPYPDRLAEGSALGEQPRLRVEAEDDDAAAKATSDVRDQAALLHLLVLDAGIRRRHAHEPGVGLVAAGGNGDRLDVLVRSNRRHRVELLDRGDILRSDRAVGGRLLRADRDEFPIHLDHVAAEAPNAVGHLLARACADRGHGDERGHADNHSESGQRGAEPVRTQ